MCFIKGLRALTISSQLGLVKTILLNIKWNCHRQTLLYRLNILTPIKKQYTSQNNFKKSIKETLLKVGKEFNYF